jgi:hypothetical protein
MQSRSIALFVHDVHTADIGARFDAVAMRSQIAF